MHNFGKMSLFADQPVNGPVEHRRKPLGIAAHHRPLHLELVFKIKNRKLKIDGLPLGNPPPGTDKNPGGTDIFYDIPERPLLDGIFGDNERRAAGETDAGLDVIDVSLVLRP